MSTSAVATTWSTPAKLNLYGNFNGTAATTQAMTMISNDIGLNPSGTNYGVWNLGASNQLNFYTQNPATVMNIGFDDGNAAHWNLDQSELGSLTMVHRG